MNIATTKVKNDTTPRSVENCNFGPSFGELVGVAVLLADPPEADVPPLEVELDPDDFSVLKTPPWA